MDITAGVTVNMFLNIFNVFILYSVFYILFTILGLSLSRLVFSSRSYFAILCSPIFGISLFCLITTALMNHFNGLIAGRIGLCLTVSLSVFLYFLNYKKKPVIHLRILSR